MKTNDVICGFRVTRVRPVPQQQGTLWELEHERLGTKVAWLEREEENKTFCISFRTVPQDDTGVFHILEHAVLGGSDAYPVREPFVELLKGSLQTFLNAFTYPDKTVYPVSSRNERDFENLVRVYLDGVFHPRCIRSPEIFDQEGWHYEPEGEGFLRNGVVLNEMKGAFSSVDTRMTAELDRLLYPDTCYRCVSGGHPDHIPELTFARFREAHSTFYHPSNALIFLDGKLTLPRLLELVDREFFAHCEPRAPVGPIPLQPPRPPVEREVFFPAMPEETSGQSAHLFLGWVVGRFDQRERLLTFDLLSDYLAGGNDAPLTRAILAEGLAQSVEASLLDGVQQPAFTILLRNLAPRDRERAQGVVDRVLAETVRDGLDRERMAALIDNARFRTREQSFGWMPSGVGLAMAVLDSWNYGGDPLSPLENDKTLALLRERLDTGYFERMVDELRHGGSRAAVFLLPDPHMEEAQAAEEEARVRRAVEAMDEGEREELRARFCRLRQTQDAQDSPEALATIPRLTLADVERRPREIPTQVRGDVLFHPLPTRGIQYWSLYFPLGDAAAADLPRMAAAVAMLGELDTEARPSQELDKRILSDLGSFRGELVTYQDREDPGRCSLYLRVSCSALREKTPQVLELLPEILLTTRFDNTRRVRDILTQMAQSFRQQFVEEGSQLAMDGVLSGLLAAGRVAEATGGLTCFRWIQDTLARFDGEAEGICRGLKEVCAGAFTRGGLVISLTGEDDPEALAALRDAFPRGEARTPTSRFVPHGVAAQGVEIPAGVGYGAYGACLPPSGSRVGGLHHVLARLLSLDYLWQEVRVKGGAYGTGMRFLDSGAVVFHSYRDPDPAASLEVFRRTADHLEEALGEGVDLTQVILGTVAAADPLLTPAMSAARADNRWFSGKRYEELCREWEEMLSADRQKLLALRGDLKAALDGGKSCVAGGREQLEGCTLSRRETL